MGPSQDPQALDHPSHPGRNPHHPLPPLHPGLGMSETNRKGAPLLCTIELLRTHPPDQPRQTSERPFTFPGPGDPSRQGTSLTTITTGQVGKELDQQSQDQEMVVLLYLAPQPMGIMRLLPYQLLDRRRCPLDRSARQSTTVKLIMKMS